MENFIKEISKNELMMMTDTDKLDFKTAKCCHICKQDLTTKRVRDHDHQTGKYRGAAHPKCNLEYYSNRCLPVVVHNLRGYDSHLIITEVHNLYPEKTLFTITNSYEKFMSF